jgi:hypothetical protein
VYRGTDSPDGTLVHHVVMFCVLITKFYVQCYVVTVLVIINIFAKVHTGAAYILRKPQ